MSIQMKEILAKIEHEFALESITIKHTGWVHCSGHISGAWIEKGTYPVGKENVLLANSNKLVEASPLMAHFLRLNGYADITYKNGKTLSGKHFAQGA